jgi:hypothetical protein
LKISVHFIGETERLRQHCFKTVKIPNNKLWMSSSHTL